MTDYRTTYSWKESLDLGPHLVRLAEALPEHEQSGMVLQLHQIMLDLPSRVAQDIATGSQSRNDVVYRLNAAVELIDRVYPALDTAEVRSLLSALETRLGGETFTEAIELPVAAAPVFDEPAEELTAQEAVTATIESTPATEPSPEVAPIAVAQSAPIAVSAAPAQTIAITPAADAPVSDPAMVNVQPDSVQ